MTRPLPLARLTDINPPVFRKTGRTPWRIGKATFTIGGHVDILDADDNVMFFCSPELAGRIVGAVNLVECAHHVEGRGNRLDEQS